MKLKLLDEVLEFNNEETSINEMFQQINNRVNERGVHLSHLVVNGVEVYEDHGEYILERLSTIETVEAIVHTTKQLLSSILLSAETYLKRAVPEVNNLVDEFYSTPTEESWQKLVQLLEGLQWITQMINNIDQLDHKILNWNEYLTSMATLETELIPLMEAIENKDTVLIADIIQYEVLPILERLQIISTTTIDEQGERIELS
ncbi:hypothetical protein [Alkalihalobacterium sp. APHAB7]|uniref:hypothetical protein n=1 Tax=Alkalihalobacterium sp. APHAB7 TaxID=3402081 RepID=UPI003AB04BE9